MDLSKVWFENKLKELEDQRNRYLANLNAVIGAIQLCEQALIEFDKKLPEQKTGDETV